MKKIVFVLFYLPFHWLICCRKMHLPPAKARVRRRAFLSDTLWPSFRCAQEWNSHHKMVPSPCFPWICRAEHWKLPQNYFVESLFGILASGAGRQWNILFPSGVSKSFCFGIFPRTRLLAQQPKTTSVNSDNPCIFFPSPVFASTGYKYFVAEKLSWSLYIHLHLSS